jgi:hypothetical protein
MPQKAVTRLLKFKKNSEEAAAMKSIAKCNQAKRVQLKQSQQIQKD